MWEDKKQESERKISAMQVRSTIFSMHAMGNHLTNRCGGDVTPVHRSGRKHVAGRSYYDAKVVTLASLTFKPAQ